jgi:hypothetical protein
MEAVTSVIIYKSMTINKEPLRYKLEIRNTII